MIIIDAVDSKNSKTGPSPFSGFPDLIDVAASPQWQDRPMQFIGQFNLADVSKRRPQTDKKGYVNDRTS